MKLVDIEDVQAPDQERAQLEKHATSKAAPPLQPPHPPGIAYFFGSQSRPPSCTSVAHRHHKRTEVATRRRQSSLSVSRSAAFSKGCSLGVIKTSFTSSPPFKLFTSMMSDLKQVLYFSAGVCHLETNSTRVYLHSLPSECTPPQPKPTAPNEKRQQTGRLFGMEVLRWSRAAAQLWEARVGQEIGNQAVAGCVCAAGDRLEAPGFGVNVSISLQFIPSAPFLSPRNEMVVLDGDITMQRVLICS